MRKSAVAASFLALSFSQFSMADVIGAGVQASYWNSSLSGEAAQDNDVVDVEDNLDLDSDSTVNLTAYLEHPVPVLPNVRLNHTRIEQSGRGELTAGFGDITVAGEVDSELELSQTDLTLYYEVLDNWVNLDLGLTARSIDGELTVQQVAGALENETDISAVLPMGYVAARFDLPFTGVSAGAEVNAIGYGGDSVYDYNAYGQYEIAVVQLRAGYRSIAIDVEDGDDRLDIEIGGPFISAGVAF